MVEPNGYPQELIMKAELIAVSIILIPARTSLLVSAVTVALGTFVAASPHRAAGIWGSQRLASLTPERRVSVVRWYRAFGLLLCLAGILLAVDSVAS
jgi:hypothetical protein